MGRAPLLVDGLSVLDCASWQLASVGLQKGHYLAARQHLAERRCLVLVVDRQGGRRHAPMGRNFGNFGEVGDHERPAGQDRSMPARRSHSG